MRQHRCIGPRPCLPLQRAGEDTQPRLASPCFSTIISAALVARRRRVSARFASPIHRMYSLRCDGGRAPNILSAAAARASSIDVCRPIRTCPSCRPTTSTRPRWCLGRRGGGGTAIGCTLRALPNRGRQPGCCSSTGQAGTAGRCGPSPHWWPHAVSTSVPSVRAHEVSGSRSRALRHLGRSPHRPRRSRARPPPPGASGR